MKKKIPSDIEMSPEYALDYSKAKKNRFAEDYHISVTLDSDVADVFKDSESVNKALRAIITAIPKPSGSTQKPSQQKD